MFTCITCHVVFSDPEAHRSHYKSEWHRYNLKRKVAELPPITEEQFLTKQSQQKSLAETKETLSAYCQACKKYFASRNALEAHLKSKKHESCVKISTKNEPNKAKCQTKHDRKPNALQDSAEDDDSEAWDSCDDEEEDDFCRTCPFCACSHEDVEANVRHMSLAHSFFVPDVEYVVDLPGLVAYLCRLVFEDSACIRCRKVFRSSEAARRHMADLGHGEILHEGDGLLEFAEFYDYSSGHPGGSEDPEGKAEVPECLDDGGWELVLPSGTKVGHRSLARYYRQNLRPRCPEKMEKSRRSIRLIASGYRALGWTGSSAWSVVSKARDIAFMKRVQSKKALKLGVKSNKFQPHFRPQVVF